MKRPLALLAGTALLSVALATPASALDVPPVSLDPLTVPIEQLTGALGLGSASSADDADDANREGAKDKVGDVRGESRTRSDVAGASRDQKEKKYRAPRNLPKSGAGDSSALLALAGLGLIAAGGFAYSAGKR